MSNFFLRFFLIYGVKINSLEEKKIPPVFWPKISPKTLKNSKKTVKNMDFECFSSIHQYIYRLQSGDSNHIATQCVTFIKFKKIKKKGPKKIPGFSIIGLFWGKKYLKMCFFLIIESQMQHLHDQLRYFCITGQLTCVEVLETRSGVTFFGGACPFGPKLGHNRRQNLIFL